MLRLRLPPKTTEVLGEEAAAELAQWFAETITVSRDELVSRDEFREVLSHLDIIEHDLSGVKEHLNAIEVRFDSRFDAVNARFDTMEGRFYARFDTVEGRFYARFDSLQSDINARLDTVNSRFDAMEERFDARFDHLQSDMNARMDTIHDVVRSQTRWLIATLIALGGLISALITIFEFIK